jgi:hypothetical protein
VPESIKITGLAESLGMLRELARDDENGPKTAKGIVRRGTGAGGKVMLAAVEDEAPEKSGRIKRSLKVRRKSSKGKIGVSIGTRAKDFTGPTFYAGFAIWGHLAGSRKLGPMRKHVPGNDFISRGYDRSKDQAAEVTAQKIIEGIDKAATG